MLLLVPPAAFRYCVILSSIYLVPPTLLHSFSSVPRVGIPFQAAIHVFQIREVRITSLVNERRSGYKGWFDKEGEKMML